MNVLDQVLPLQSIILPGTSHFLAGIAWQLSLEIYCAYSTLLNRVSRETCGHASHTVSLK
jgi:hypothetical protein